jgi:hypothetical protein
VVTGHGRELWVQAVISDFSFDLDLALNDGQRDEFAQLLEAAARVERCARSGYDTAYGSPRPHRVCGDEYWSSGDGCVCVKVRR